MRYELLIGLRYLRSRRREGFISLITAIAAVGLIIGVMTLNIVLAVFSGFEEDLRDRILGFNPHAVVLSFNGIISDPATVVERVEAVPGVVAAAPFVYGPVLLSVQEHVSGAVVRGVGATSEKVLELQRHLQTGTVDALHATQRVTLPSGATAELPALIIGKGVARELGLGVGDVLNVVSPTAMAGAAAVMPRMTRFAVAGIFDSGMSEYDASLVYMDLAHAQRFFALGGTVSGVEVRLADLYAAREVARRIDQQLGFPFRVRDWMDINHNLFAALKLGKTVYFIVLLLIVLVAAFNIVAMLIMVVMEKRKDIAILKSMGATRAGIRRIFVFKGMVIGVLGAAVGNAGAYLACLLLGHYRFIKLPADVYAVDTLQVRMHPAYFAAVTVASLLICLLATIYPARQAARLAPVDVIRYE